MSTELQSAERLPADVLNSTDDLKLFARRVFASIPRADQRRWAEIYMRGLLLGGGPKSIRRTAEQLYDGSAIQSLQQFVNQSPWSWTAVRERIVREVLAGMETEAWVLECAVTRKRGDRSVGVDRRFVPAEGRVVNCQVGLGIIATSRTRGVPLDWRLLLSPRWLDDPVRRRKARIPEDARSRPDWEEVVDMVTEMRDDWGLEPRPLLAEWRRSPHATDLIHALAELRQPFVIEVDGSVPATNAPLSLVTLARPGRPGIAPGQVRPVEQYAAQWQSSYRHTVVAAGDLNQPWARLASMPIRLPAGGTAGVEQRNLRLVAARYLRQQRFARFWITNLTGHSTEQLMSLLRLRGVGRGEAERLYGDFGFSDFEGRSYVGWHHHVTLVSAASAYAALHE